MAEGDSSRKGPTPNLHPSPFLLKLLGLKTGG
jgi:hypothetical protein